MVFDKRKQLNFRKQGQLLKPPKTKMKIKNIVLTLMAVLMLTVSMFSQDYTDCRVSRGSGVGFQGQVLDTRVYEFGVPAPGVEVYAVMQDPPYDIYISTTDIDGYFGTDVDGNWTWYKDGIPSPPSPKGPVNYLPQCFHYNITMAGSFSPNPFYVHVGALGAATFRTFRLRN